MDEFKSGNDQVVKQLELSHEIVEKDERVINTMKERQQALGRDFTVVCSDFDNSFFGYHDSSNIKDSLFLRTLLKENNIPLIIITGGDAVNVIKKMIEAGMEPPEVIVAKAGTEIYYRINKINKKNGNCDFEETNPDDILKTNYVSDTDFYQEVCASGFNRKTLVESSEDLIRVLKEYQFVFQKPEDEERFLIDNITDQPHKLSFYFFDNNDSRATDKILIEVKEWLNNLGFEAEVLICEEINYNRDLPPHASKKYCLDLVPKIKRFGCGGKKAAMLYLINKFEAKRGIIAGDSGNDAEMMINPYGSWFLRVVVGGAKPELWQAFSNKHRHRQIGATPFRRFLDEELKRIKFFMEDDDRQRVAAASILEAIRQRLIISLRFEANPENRPLIQKIITEIDNYLNKQNNP